MFKLTDNYKIDERIDKLKEGRTTTLQKAIAFALKKYLSKDEILHDWEFKFEVEDAPEG